MAISIERERLFVSKRSQHGEAGSQAQSHHGQEQAAGAGDAAAGAQPATAEGTVEYAGSSSWTPSKGYVSWTKYGEVKMFEEGGHRAVELMLLSAAACLNYFLVEYAKARNLPLTSIRVVCDGEPAKRPERLSRIVSRVVIEGNISDEERRKMLTVCERACKVMNTLRYKPECEAHLVTPSGREIA